MDGIEIYEHGCEGFKELMRYQGWRICMLNYAERFIEGRELVLERHLETDEAFLLLCGKATLTIGEQMVKYPLEPLKVYNVKKGTWHATECTPGTQILVIENSDTTPANSEKLIK